MLGDIQYVTDTFVIERTWKTIAAIENNYKTAFDLGSLLESVGSSVKQFIGGQIHDKDSGGITRTILDFLVPATFFRIHPLLGVAVTAAQILGFDLYTIYGKIVNEIKPKLEEGKQITSDEINSAANSAMTIIPEDDVPDNGTVTSSQDYFYFLREAEYKGYFTKTAQNVLSLENKTHPFLPKQTDNILIRMFGRFGKRKVANIVVGILVWFLKTVLLSAGLLTVGGVALNALTKKPEVTNTTTNGIIPASFNPQPKSTGAGSKLYKTSPGDLWLESLYGDDPEERVLEWTLQSYPDLNQYQDIIVRTPSFQNTVNKISENYKPGQQQISIPDPYKKKDDVLNEFIGDVYKNLKAAK